MTLHLIRATQGPFDLVGGKYGVTSVATGTGSVGLSILGPDGTTFIPITAATFSTTSGFAAVDLPSGLYQVTIATFTNVNFSVGGDPNLEPPVTP